MLTLKKLELVPSLSRKASAALTGCTFPLMHVYILQFLTCDLWWPEASPLLWFHHYPYYEKAAQLPTVSKALKSIKVQKTQNSVTTAATFECCEIRIELNKVKALDTLWKLKQGFHQSSQDFSPFDIKSLRALIEMEAQVDDWKELISCVLKSGVGWH